MDDELDQLLSALKLRTIRERIDDVIASAEKEGTSFRATIKTLLREEYHAQQARVLESRIRRAKMPEQWAMETFPFERQPKLNKSQIENLAELDFIARGDNLVLIGATGTGKTGIATAILLRALQRGHRARFVKAQDLFDEMYRSLADHSSRKIVRYFASLDLLLIDELGFLNLKPEQSNILFKLMDERHIAKRSTIITTNLEYDEWFGFLGQTAMVEALLDRLRQRCVTIHIDGPSLRSPR